MVMILMQTHKDTIPHLLKMNMERSQKLKMNFSK